MSKRWRDGLIFGALALSAPLIVLLLIRLTPNPPETEMEFARESISMAGTKKADTYSKKLFNQARVYYDSAMVNWERQNKRFIYFRNFERVAMFAELAAKKANEAGENSIGSSTNLKIKLGQKIKSLNILTVEINQLFKTYPLTLEVNTRISKGKMLLKEAEIAYSKGQYLQANRKLTDAEYLLTESHQYATSNLKAYFKAFPLWKNWVDKTIIDSRKNRDYSIIIDKFSRKCFVYLNGSKKYEFDAELGKNWVGVKRVKGDQATPEGMYRITKKFEGNKTKYYKALLLDYPNDEDKARFRNEIAKGTLPASSKIGGLIEIHGNGGKGIDWTEGCVALTDREMDMVFKLVKVGTPVTIVGSTIELDKIVDR